MANTEWLNALIGGLMIGMAASIMLIGNGRTTGISGILYGALFSKKEDWAWRIYFLLGLIGGGVVLKILRPDFFSGALPTAPWTLVVAGLLVGFGTTLGSGCTSGHGVCGISRLSIRSIIATLVFICCGILSVFIFKKPGVFP